MRGRFLRAIFFVIAIGCGDDEGAPEQDDATAHEVPSDAASHALDAGATSSGAIDAAQHARLDAQASTADAQRSGDSDGGELPCIDEQIAQLMLFEAPARGRITDEAAQPGSFESAIDATAGGLTMTDSFIYARFTEQGLEKLAIGDEAAFFSDAWHIAFRRYVIRVNSGVSGPGRVRAARTAPATNFEALTSVPPELSYRTEAYFTESCEFIPDTSGIGAPATALSSFWSYSSCLAMTNNVFVIELPQGRHVKLQVTAYYSPENQKSCNETGKISQPSGAGNLRVRWSFLD